MIVYIKGILKEKTAQRAIIENSGIGYELNIGAMTYNELPDPPEEVMLHTYHYIREDREELYGFSSLNEKQLFEILIGVSNIGPGKAMGILSQVMPESFVNAVRSGDTASVASIKGVGKKTAERLIVDLKDKVAELGFRGKAFAAEREKIQDALAGLIGLGFKENAAREMINSVSAEIASDDKAEEIIKKALKKHG